jgi:hypothetical protein
MPRHGFGHAAGDGVRGSVIPVVTLSCILHARFCMLVWLVVACRVVRMRVAMCTAQPDTLYFPVAFRQLSRKWHQKRWKGDQSLFWQACRHRNRSAISVSRPLSRRRPKSESLFSRPVVRFIQDTGISAERRSNCMVLSRTFAF